MRTLDQTVSVVHPGIVAPKLAPPDQHELARRVPCRVGEESTARLVDKVAGRDVDLSQSGAAWRSDTSSASMSSTSPTSSFRCWQRSRLAHVRRCFRFRAPGLGSHGTHGSSDWQLRVPVQQSCMASYGPRCPPTSASTLRAGSPMPRPSGCRRPCPSVREIRGRPRICFPLVRSNSGCEFSSAMHD